MRSSVINTKWVFSWKWGVVRVASELIPRLEDLPRGDVSQGNTEHPGPHFPGKLHSPARSELTGKVSPLSGMPQWPHRGPRVLDGCWGLLGPIS